MLAGFSSFFAASASEKANLIEHWSPELLCARQMAQLVEGFSKNQRIAFVELTPDSTKIDDLAVLILSQKRESSKISAALGLTPGESRVVDEGIYVLSAEGIRFFPLGSDQLKQFVTKALNRSPSRLQSELGPSPEETTYLIYIPVAGDKLSKIGVLYSPGQIQIESQANSRAIKNAVVAKSETPPSIRNQRDRSLLSIFKKKDNESGETLESLYLNALKGSIIEDLNKLFNMESLGLLDSSKRTSALPVIQKCLDVPNSYIRDAVSVRLHDHPTLSP